MGSLVCALILGAGESEFLNVPLIKKEVNTLRDAGITKISVVLGHEEETMKRKLVHHKLTFLMNKKHEKGQMLDSIKLGLKSMPAKCSKVVIILSDTPSFSLDTINKLIREDGDVVIPTNEGKRGHPVVLKKEIIDKIISYEEDGGLRGAIEKNAFEIKEVEVDDEGILIDVDTHEEYSHILDFEKARLEKSPITIEAEVRLSREIPFCDMELVNFLQIVDREGSMNKACKFMEMSYSKAWKMVNDAERQIGFSLIERQVGGKKGGKSSLTPKGQKLIDGFIKIQEEIEKISQKSLVNLLNTLKD